MEARSDQENIDIKFFHVSKLHTRVSPFLSQKKKV